MTDQDKHWEANNLINIAIYHIQLAIEAHKKEIKTARNGVCRSGLMERSAIHGLASIRREMIVYEYFQQLLDDVALEKNTLDSIKEFIVKAQKRKH